MTKTKYVVSEGIAFSEKKDLRVLKQYAEQGWLVKRYKKMGYELEQGTPEMVDYSIDIYTLAKGEEEEYFDMFASAGWQHVCSSYNTHLFKAPVGTVPIYSDRETKKDKLARLQQSIVPAVWLCVMATVISFIAMQLAGGIVEQVIRVIFWVALVCTVPCIAMYATLAFRQLKLS